MAPTDDRVLAELASHAEELGAIRRSLAHDDPRRNRLQAVEDALTAVAGSQPHGLERGVQLALLAKGWEHSDADLWYAPGTSDSPRHLGAAVEEQIRLERRRRFVR